jgi:hypothetical protein
MSATAVRLELITPSRAASAAGTQSLNVNADGTFRFNGIFPAAYRLRASFPQAATSDWALKSAVHGGRDFVDVPVEITADLSDLVVTISDVHAQVSGTLTDSGGRPAPDLNVLVFPASRDLWKSDRRVRTTRASDAGTYRIAGLPAGEYYVCALTEVDRQLMYEASYLQQLVPAALKITLADGEKRTLNLGTGLFSTAFHR